MPSNYKQTHQPCESCGSSDAKTYYNDGGAFCFSCNTHFKSSDSPPVFVPPSQEEGIPKQSFTEIQNILTTGDYSGITERNITVATAKTYGVMRLPDKTYFAYYGEDSDITPIAAKVRHPDKKFHTAGDFQKTLLFGQHLFAAGSSKYITITEGEFDACAVYQMTGSKWPVVSIRSGASGALRDCKNNYEYLDTFGSIVICFDSDEPGQRAAKEVAELFGGKAKVVKHLKGMKDACDYLTENKKSEFETVWWGAEKYVPDGIINGASLWSEVSKPLKGAELQYPYAGLNDLTYGIRLSELVTITAGSGLGKSQFLREITYHIMKNTEDNIGMLMLEESTRKTVESIMSLSANKPLHLPDIKATKQERKEAFDATMASGRFHFFDHWGSLGVDNVMARIRHMAKALECKYIILDHITMIVSSQANGDERKALDEVMTKLRMLVEETGCAVFAVSHLKRPDSKGHEEGAVVSLSQLRGSGAIAQLSDIVLGLERNAQADDVMERNTTKVRVLKNRFSGLTGPSCLLHYDQITGRLSEVKEVDNAKAVGKD